jgi:hypothetical protein
LKLSRLTDVQARLDEAVEHLREQQNLVSGADSPRTHALLIKLLSNGLRLYCWLEDQRDGLIEQLGEYLSLKQRR